MRISTLVPSLCLAAAAAAAPQAPVDVVAEVLARNPELAFYEAELAAARAGRLAAGRREAPELAVEIGRKRVTEPGGDLAGEGTAWSVSVTQAFEWPGRLALRKAIANHDVALAELGLAGFRAALRSRARTLAAGLFAAQERARAAAEVAARYQALRESFLARDPGGITPLLETRVIEAQELVLQRRATEAELAVQAALAEFNGLRGRPADEGLVVSALGTGAGPPPPPAVDALRAAAGENNFELRAARLEVERQGFSVALARTDGRPGFQVSPFVEQERAGERERMFGVGLSLPLPAGGRTAAGVAAAEARRRQAEAALAVAQRDLEREVTLAAGRLSARLAEAARWAPDAAGRFREAAELADRHYRLGAVPVSTYVELQNSYLEAVEAIHETRLDAIAAAGELERLTGLDLLGGEGGRP